MKPFLSVLFASSILLVFSSGYSQAPPPGKAAPPPDNAAPLPATQFPHPRPPDKAGGDKCRGKKGEAKIQQPRTFSLSAEPNLPNYAAVAQRIRRTRSSHDSIAARKLKATMLNV